MCRPLSATKRKKKKTSITPKTVGRIHHKKPALMSGPAKSPSHASRSGPQQIDGYTTPRSLHCWPSSVCNPAPKNPSHPARRWKIDSFWIAARACRTIQTQGNHTLHNAGLFRRLAVWCSQRHHSAPPGAARWSLNMTAKCHRVKGFSSLARWFARTASRIGTAHRLGMFGCVGSIC